MYIENVRYTYRMIVDASLLVLGDWWRLESPKKCAKGDITSDPHEMGLVISWDADKGVSGTAHSGFSITTSDSFCQDNRFLFYSVESAAGKMQTKILQNFR